MTYSIDNDRLLSTIEIVDMLRPVIINSPWMKLVYKLRFFDPGNSIAINVFYEKQHFQCLCFASYYSVICFLEIK